MKLVRVRPQLEPAVRELASEYEASGLPRFSDILDDYPAAVARLAANERGEADPHAGVPFTFFLAERDDRVLVGTLRLRHHLIDSLWQDGGHVGYDVRPSMWNRGYATEMLALAFEEARRIGLEWVLITVSPNNVASIRVIEKNGAERIGVADQTGFLQFRFDLRGESA